MPSATGRRVRRSIADIQADYDAGNKEELEDLMRAWRGIKELGPNEFRSFFMIGGFHGEPFRGPGAQTPTWWGGYCQHGTVPVPDLASRLSLPPGKRVAQHPGLRVGDAALLGRDRRFEPSERHSTRSDRRNLHARRERDSNPLRSFVLPATIVDAVTGDNSLYGKPQGYETVRYPLAGLVGTPDERAKTAAHNARFPTPETRTALLNGNIKNWLNVSFTVGGNKVGLVYQKFLNCLNAPNYTLFSNTTSMNNWNDKNPKALVVALENPITACTWRRAGSTYRGKAISRLFAARTATWARTTRRARPDLYFHHCFIDYVFWIWQRRHGATESLDIDANDPGAKYDLQINPPPAGADPNATMSLTTPLEPFFKEYGVPFTTADVINIITAGLCLWAWLARRLCPDGHGAANDAGRRTRAEDGACRRHRPIEDPWLLPDRHLGRSEGQDS